MLLPGPEAMQLATYIGWRVHGIKGGVIAGSMFVIPSIFFLLALSYIYAEYGNVPEISAILTGFKAVVVAIVIEAVLKIGGKAFKTFKHVLFAALSFAAIYFFHVPFPAIVVAAAVLGFLILRDDIEKSSQVSTEESSKFGKAYFLKVISSCLVLWIVPFAVVLFAFGSGSIASQVYLFFTQAAFVTFGGAYSVLAYVNQAVVSSGWITSAQAVDGLALAETTPGPLIMVLQFIGFMTGWNNPNGFSQTSYAIICSLLATYVTFLPSFAFILVGAPYIERLRNNVTLKAALSGVTAAVVGVILNLAFTFAGTVIFPNNIIEPFSLVMATTAFAALYFLKTNVLWIVILSGLCGLIKYALIG